METMFGFAALALATLLGLFVALALQVLALRLAFYLMQPATADHRPLRPPVERGALLAARAYGRTRQMKDFPLAYAAPRALRRQPTGNRNERKSTCSL